MNRFKKVLYIFLAILGLTGCFPFDEGEESTIVGRYYLRGDSKIENVHIGYEDSQYGGIGLINESITAIGHNDSYIIAKSDIGAKSYYILEVVENGVHGDAEKAIIGPLEKAEFDAKLKELGLSHSLKFDRPFN